MSTGDGTPQVRPPDSVRLSIPIQQRPLSVAERTVALEQGLQRAIASAVGANATDDESTWARARHAASDYLYAEWRSGVLLGDTPETAYFVKCDRTTMTQIDIDNGRLIVLAGVALVKPAEFVILRISETLGNG